ncbi:MAG: AzlD domain-containing protein [Anaerolineae bacterium]|nr:AzlD domain-containing protein [Anaerolineae bacterium]
MTGSELLMIVGMTVVTFGVRYPVLALVGRLQLPQPVIRALRYVPVAVLTAIIVPELLIRDGSWQVNPSNAYLVAGIVSALISWRTKNLLLTIVVGMGVFLLWRAITGA